MTLPNPRATNITRAVLYLAVWLTGFASMSVELTGIRALAPFWGTSVFIWTHVIGVILAALSLGYYVGGKLADRWQDYRPLGWILLITGGFTVACPHLVPLLANWLLPANLRLEDALPVFWGTSLFVSLLLFAPCAFLFSFTSPTALRFLCQTHRVGTTAGAVFALSTLGSIMGTFLTTYLLIPYMGTRWSFLLIGLSSGLAGLLLVLHKNSWRGKDHLLVLLLVAISIVAGWGTTEPIKTIAPGETLLSEQETKYQYAQIIKQDKQIILRVNEGLDSYQSLWIEGQWLTNAYYDYFLLAPLFAQRPGAESLRVAVLGLGGGTTSRQYHKFFAQHYDLDIDGVEIDAALVAMAAKPFAINGQEQPHLHLWSDFDARAFLAACQDDLYDVILLDTYAAQIQIPFHLATQEFFQLVKEKLQAGGILAINVGAISAQDQVFLAVANTVCSVFDKVLTVPVRDARNQIIYARKNAKLPSSQSIYQNNPIDELTSLLGYVAFPGMAQEKTFLPYQTVFTDDRSHIELLQIQALWTRP